MLDEGPLSLRERVWSKYFQPESEIAAALYVHLPWHVGAIFAIGQRVWKNSVSRIDQSYSGAASSIIEACMSREVMLSQSWFSLLIARASEGPYSVGPLRAESEHSMRTKDMVFDWPSLACRRRVHVLFSRTCVK